MFLFFSLLYFIQMNSHLVGNIALKAIVIIIIIIIILSVSLVTVCSRLKLEVFFAIAVILNKFYFPHFHNQVMQIGKKIFEN